MKILKDLHFIEYIMIVVFILIAGTISWTCMINSNVSDTDTYTYSYTSMLEGK